MNRKENPKKTTSAKAKQAKTNTARARRPARQEHGHRHGKSTETNVQANMDANTVSNRDTEATTESETEANADPVAEKTGADALEDYRQSIKRYPSGWQLLCRIEQAVSDIEDENEKDAARVELCQWIIDEAGKLDGKIAQTDEGQAARSRHQFAKYIFPDDPVLLKIKAGIEYLVLVQQEMIQVQGLPPDAMQMLVVNLLIEQRVEALRSRLADKSPEPDLAVVLFVALEAWSAGRLIEAAIERGRELTRDEVAELTADSVARLRNLPAIVDQMMPDALDDYVDAEFPCGAEESIYAEPYTRYCEFYQRRFGRRPPSAGKLNKLVVDEVRQSPDVPQTDYRTFYQGLTDERRRVLLESQKRRRAKKADQKK